MSIPKGVRVWMAEKDYKQVDIARKHKKSFMFVNYFLRGKRTSSKMVNFLVKDGCPEEYFKNGRVA